MSQIGHNRGPELDGATSWRQHCWKKARRDLIPRLPIEILRTRVKRAEELGLEYKTYASVRASTGRDVIGFLFSSNALRAFRLKESIPEERKEKLSNLKGCKRIVLVTAPMSVQAMAKANPTLDLEFARAPAQLAGWRETVELLDAPRRAAGLPSDGVLLIGDTTLEQEWCAAGRLAGYLPADRFFVPNP